MLSHQPLAEKAITIICLPRAATAILHGLVNYKDKSRFIMSFKNLETFAN